MSGNPDQRMQEFAERMRQLEAQNAQLRGTIDAMSMRSQQSQQPTQEDPGPFEPATAKALNDYIQRRVQAMIEPHARAISQNFGAMKATQDQQAFMIKYGAKEWEKNGEKIQRIQQERSLAGQYVDPETAYAFLKMKETTGATPSTPNQEVPPAPAPQLDQYGMPMQPTQAQATPPQNGMNPMGQPAVAPQTPNQVQPQVMAPPSMSGELPHLPAQGVSPASKPVPPSAPQKIDLLSPQSDLDAFANQYAEMPI